MFIASASFPESQVISITGETRCYNGLEVDGVGALGIPDGINYRFCAVCGSSVYFDMVFPGNNQRFITIALGCFVGETLPAPSTEYFTDFRQPWVAPVPDAAQIPDPKKEAWRAMNAAKGQTPTD